MPHLEFSDLTVLLVQVGTIVVVSRILGIVTRWLGQPLVIAEVVAGIVLGPSLLGWLAPGLMHALFPPSSLQTLKLLSQVGLVLFMFMIGLELDPKLLRGKTHSSVVISHSSIVVPFGLGVLAAFGVYDTYSTATVPFASFVLFLGVSMSVTAFPVLARILSERQLMSSRVGVIAIACAAVDDVTAWCLLALVVAVARARGVGSALWTTALALAFILIMLFLVRPFMRRLGTRVANREGLTSTVMAAIFVMLLVSSTITELIGIHALFGAFLFGAIFPKEGKLAETLIERVESVAVVLFLPLFFAYSGLRTQIGLVNGVGEYLVTGLFILVATVGKFGGSTIAGRLTGLRWREASAIGVLMNTRGLMELIVLNIGLDIGVISPTVFTMLVIMALVTTFATTPVLQWIYPQREMARDRVVERVPESPKRDAFTVVMCVSDPNPGIGFAHIASALKGTQRDPSRLIALHLWRPSDRPSVEQRRATEALETSPLQRLLSRAQELELDVQPLAFVSSEVGKDICRTAEAVQASVVLVGVHKPLLFEGNFGGVVRHVLANAVSQVGVFIDRGLMKVERVLLVGLSTSDQLLSSQLVRRIVTAPEMAATYLRPEAGIVATDTAEPGAVVPAMRMVYVRSEEMTEIALRESEDHDLLMLAIGSSDTDVDASYQRIVEEASCSVLVLRHAGANVTQLTQLQLGSNLVPPS